MYLIFGHQDADLCFGLCTIWLNAIFPLQNAKHEERGRRWNSRKASTSTSISASFDSVSKRPISGAQHHQAEAQRPSGCMLPSDAIVRESGRGGEYTASLISILNMERFRDACTIPGLARVWTICLG